MDTHVFILPGYISRNETAASYTNSFAFWEISTLFSKIVYHFILPLAMYCYSNFCTSSPTHIIVCSLIIAIPDGVKWSFLKNWHCYFVESKFFLICRWYYFFKFSLVPWIVSPWGSSLFSCFELLSFNLETFHRCLWSLSGHSYLKFKNLLRMLCLWIRLYDVCPPCFFTGDSIYYYLEIFSLENILSPV